MLKLLGAHFTNAEIAAQLFISVRTVESHVASMLRKLEVPDRRALAQRAAIDRPQQEPVALPAPLTSFIGRTGERVALAEMIIAHRQVTAVGPGGVGKTRLALAVAAEAAGQYADGVWFVDLIPLTDPGMIATAVAGALGLGEQPGRDLTDSVLAALADRHALLVFDNCEHVVDGVALFLERLLAACPHVKVLATSQARLMVAFERCIRSRRCRWPASRTRSRCSPNGPRRPAGRWTRHSTTRSRRSVRDWTAWRWRSSWPQPAMPRSGWTGSPPLCPTRCGCSSAGLVPMSGTARCGPCWTGATPCWSRSTSSSCTGCPSS